MAGFDREEEARARARLSNLVLTFETNLWDQILCWPWPVEKAQRTPVSKRDYCPFDEVIRICKLVQTCKTFYNRYRERNNCNWIEYKLLKYNLGAEEPDCFTLVKDDGVVKTGGRPRLCRDLNQSEHWGDWMELVFDNISLNVQYRLTSARPYHTSWADDTRHRQYVQRRITFKFDVSINEASIVGTVGQPLVVRGWAMNPAIAHYVPDLYESDADGRAKGVYIVRKEVVVAPGRIGHSTNRQRVPTLPDGPDQYTDLYWAPHTINVYLDIKVPGGKILLTGSVHTPTFGLQSGASIAGWVASLTRRRDGSIEPSRRSGYVAWERIEFLVDCVCPKLPNVRVFMPPQTIVKGSEMAGAPSKQGRPGVPNFDEEEEDDE